MGLTDKDIENANRRGELRRAGKLVATAARYDHASNRIVVVLESGVELSFPPQHAEGLAEATPAQLADIELSPSGLGIHFRELDADLYVPTLIHGVLGSKRWMASQIGRLGGQAASVAKSAAARENGRLGGRPRTKEAAKP